MVIKQCMWQAHCSRESKKIMQLKIMVLAFEWMKTGKTENQ